jgi:hypothetical protein
VRRSPPLTWLSNAATVSDRDSVCDKHVVSGADVLMVWVLREGERTGYLSGGATVAERDVVCEGEAMCCSLSALISRLQYLSPLRDPLHLSMNPITEKTNQSVPVREGRILHL